ncbi:MAG: tyrosine-protein phosphatase [Acidimicrobiales bacterium]
MDDTAILTDDMAIDGVFNFRDLGGLTTVGGRRTRPGLVYRADGLHRASPEGRRHLVGRGVRRVIDLRTAEETDREGRFDGEGVIYLHVPVVDSLGRFGPPPEGVEDLLLHHYRGMLDDNGAGFARVLGLVADSLDAAEPVVFHCAAGKDRTGVLAALLLAGIGVDDNIVADDYARSHTAMTHMVAWLEQRTDGTREERMAAMGLTPELASAMLRAERATMLALLAELRVAHGTLGSFLDALGAGPHLLRIANRLLEPAV